MDRPHSPVTRYRPNRSSDRAGLAALEIGASASLGELERKTAAHVGVVADMTAQHWRLATLGMAAVTGAAVAFAPLMSTSSCFTTSVGDSVCTSSQASLVSSEGWAVLFILAVPALIAVLPVAVSSDRSTFVAAATLTAVTVLALMSVGVFFVPTVVLAWVAVSVSRRSHDSQHPYRTAAQ